MEGELHVIIILDESGSMDPIKKDIIGSFNKFIRDQQALDSKDTTLVTFIKFNDKITSVFEKTKLEDVKEITSKDYVPDRCTALDDAVGTMIDKYSKDKNVCMVVITDGEENASRKYTRFLVKDKIDERKKEGWKFIYLSSDMETALQGAKLGIGSTEPGVVTGQNNVCVGYRQLSHGISNVVSECVSQLRRESCMYGVGSKL